MVFALGTTAEPTPEEVAEIMDYFEEILLEVDSALIFTHNLTIALPMFIPGFGAVWGFFRLGLQDSLLLQYKWQHQNLQMLTHWHFY